MEMNLTIKQWHIILMALRKETQTDEVAAKQLETIIQDHIWETSEWAED